MNFIELFMKIFGMVNLFIFDSLVEMPFDTEIVEVQVWAFVTS